MSRHLTPIDISDGNYSTRFEEGTSRRERFLDRLISCQAMAFPSIHDRAYSGKEVSSPVGAKPVRHFPKDCAHADGLFAGVIGRGHGGIFQQDAQVLLDLGIAFPQPETVGVRGLAG